MRALVLVALTASLAGCLAAAKLPCDETKLRAIDADYINQVTALCLPKYDTKEECPDFERLKADHKQRLNDECGVSK